MKTIITLASSVALVAAGAGGTYAYQQRIETQADLAVCTGIFLAMEWMDPAVERAGDRVGSAGTVYIDDEYSVRRGLERRERLGEHNGWVDAFNLVNERYGSRGCERNFVVGDKRRLCNELRQFQASDRRLMQCPD